MQASIASTDRGGESRRRTLWHLIAHEVRRAHAGTVLGLGWAVLQPVMILGAFFFLFTVLRVTRHAPHGPLGEVAIILSGIVPWFFFIRSFSHGIGTLDAHAALVKQINFPIVVLPFVNVGVNLVDYGIGLVMVLGLSIAKGWAGWWLLMLIPATLLLTLFLVGLTAFLAPIGAMLRDLRELVPLVVRLGLWVSPVLYLPGTIPIKFHWAMYANPLMYFIGLFRWGAYGSNFGTRHVLLLGLPATIGIAIGLCVISLTLGWLSWRRVRRGPVDYL